MNDIYFSGNCYWCAEAIFKKVLGVRGVVSGMINMEPYVHDGDVESIKVTYESSEVGLDTLFEIFFFSHTASLVSWEKKKCISPLNRSAIFTTSLNEKLATDKYVKQVQDAQTKPFEWLKDSFVAVSEKEQNWYEKNKSDGYACSIIIPKLKKLLSQYGRKLKATEDVVEEGIFV